ncbi:MAG TPA: vanadium-dependent haloperoxidase [Solirubrobacteraceae bacterium]|nr:vanadium-dependent haloperoxidase [Solirubrobacteraceae bacterium]
MADAITHWNDVLLKVIRQVGGAPGPITRGAAMMHASVYDAVNSIAPSPYRPYLVSVPAAPNASIEAAVAQAAYATLTAAFPTTTVPLGEILADEINALPPGPEVAAGESVGKHAAAAMLAARHGDGADDTAAYVSNPPAPGDWRPTGSGDAAGPYWGHVRPFCIPTGQSFRPPRPGGYAYKKDMLKSSEYAAQFNEVQRLGSAASVTRTPEQTEIAFFWANDLDGTYKPPGQLFEITRAVSEQRGLDIVENARLFALVALGMADAGICAWDAKYDTSLDLWRPETAIHLAGSDGNPATHENKKWKPLSKNPATGKHFSPPFPAYVSGHATFAAAHAAVMRRYFGTDNVTFTAKTEDPNLPDCVERSFNSFTEAARENARSRVYLGVHFQWDGDHGLISGNALGEYVYDHVLRPVGAC